LLVTIGVVPTTQGTCTCLVDQLGRQIIMLTTHLAGQLAGAQQHLQNVVLQLFHIELLAVGRSGRFGAVFDSIKG